MLKHLWFLTFLIIVFPAVGHSATITATSCSYADVRAAIFKAANGDTVTVPTGDCTWSSNLTFTRGITLQGAGCATDAKGRAGQPCGTIIRDNSTNTPSGSPMIRWNCVTGQNHRMTGFEFRNGGRTAYSGQPVILIDCPNQKSTTVRVDHNVFDHPHGQSAVTGRVLSFDTAVGVVDHNTFLIEKNAFMFYGLSWNGIGNFGDQSWASPLEWGSADFMFVENNTFTMKSSNVSCTDGFGGARFVLRFNDFNGCTTAQHGTDSTGRQRSTRGVEVYKNAFNSVGRNWLHENRDGPNLVWGNTASGMSGGRPVAVLLKSYRVLTYMSPWGQQDGRNPWDLNDPANPYNPSAQGGGANCTTTQCTATNGSGPMSITVAGANFPINHWQNYIVNKLNCSASHGKGCAAPVVSNTATVITLAGTGGLGQNISFAAGDTFEFNKIIAGMDQPGRTGGSLLSGSNPMRPSRWNDQTDFPSIQFLNTGNGSNLLYAPGPNTNCIACTANTHYVDYDSSRTFDGTIAPNRSTIGVGTLAARPATCTTGVYYWATDQGSWNGTGDDGLLYKCTATNVWTLFYIPYDYPHPLQAP